MSQLEMDQITLDRVNLNLQIWVVLIDNFVDRKGHVQDEKLLEEVVADR